MPIGALILVSLTEDIGLTFENLSFRDFIESDTLEVDFVKLIRAVMNKSSKHDPVLAERLHQLVLSVLNQTPDIWETSRGHDCVELLSLALHSTIGTKKSRTEDRRTTQVNSDLLERELRLTFSETDFSHTLLHQAINNWESANPGRRVVLPT